MCAAQSLGTSVTGNCSQALVGAICIVPLIKIHTIAAFFDAKRLHTDTMPSFRKHCSCSNVRRTAPSQQRGEQLQRGPCGRHMHCVVRDRVHWLGRPAARLHGSDIHKRFVVAFSCGLHRCVRLLSAVH